jgi:trigger factor
VSVSKEITRLEHSSVKLTITVDKESVKNHYDDMMKDYVKTAQIPGFRKGKVPREILERKFGALLREEAFNKLLSATITEIFEDETFPKEDQPLPYSTPRLEDEPATGFDRDMVFSVVYDVLPKVKVGTWKGIEVEIPDVSTGDEDINRELDEIRERNAIVMDRDEGAAADKNDVVTINYCELDADKNPVAGSERQDFVFTLGSGYNLYQFDDDIAGMKKGETKDITKTFPENYAPKEFAGKTLTVRVTLTAIKEKQLPELDDDLAQDVDEKFKTLDDLKNSIREQLSKNLKKRLRDITVSKILEKVMETTPIDLPESMVRIELESRWRTMARRFNVTPEELERNLRDAGEDTEKVLEGWKDDAGKALKSRLIVETLMRDLQLEASGEDAEKEFERIAADSETSLEEVKKYYDKENVREYLLEDIKEGKLFDMIIAENKTRRGTRQSYLEFMSQST